MSDKITIDDVYEIAAEVAEETVIKFLKNLVKLVPTADEVVDSIKDAQYEELQNYRKGAGAATVARVQEAVSRKKPIITAEDLAEDVDNEFASIAHPAQANSAELDVDDALSQIPLDTSDLFGQAMNSPVD